MASTSEPGQFENMESTGVGLERAMKNYVNHDSVLDISSGASVGGQNKERDNVSDKEVSIKSFDSVVDTASNRRQRILKAQMKPMRFSEGHKNTLAHYLGGQSFGELCWSWVARSYLFYTLVTLSVAGLALTIADLITLDMPVVLSLCCASAVPWGLVVLLLLKVDILLRLLKTFNIWFLLSQIMGMIVCVGYVAERPMMVLMIALTLIASVLVDAFPQEYRWRVTLISYVTTIVFALSFDVSMFLSLFPVENDLSFTINKMEFSGKALAFGCSLNILIFFARSLSVLLFYPNCLVLYTSSLRSDRFDPNKHANESWRIELGDSTSDSIIAGQTSSATVSAKMVWVLVPQSEATVIQSKKTVVARYFGTGANKFMWKTVKNPLTFLSTIPAIICLLPLFDLGEAVVPPWVCVFALGGLNMLIPSLLILNFKLLKRLFACFQVWFLIFMSVIVLVSWFSAIYDTWRTISVPLLASGLSFSILLDAYPASGRYLAGVRFYCFKLLLSFGVVILMIATNAPERYFVKEAGEVTFSGAALAMSAAGNLAVFGLRNMAQLIIEPECLVVLTSLLEYKRVPEDVADRLIRESADSTGALEEAKDTATAATPAGAGGGSSASS
eukprot:g403.t1